MSEQNFIEKVSSLTPEAANALDLLSEVAQSVLALIEYHWWTSKKLLNQQETVKLSDLDPIVVNEVFKNSTFQHALRSKGFVSEATFKNSLTPKQILAANIMTTRQDTRSTREKLKEAGVTISQWNGWMSNLVFYKYVQGKSGFDFKTAEVQAERTLLNAMEEGDLTATKMFLEMRGRYQNKVSVNLNFDLMITQIVETLSRFIPEEMLEEAADALERIYAVNSGRNLDMSTSAYVALEATI